MYREREEKESEHSVFLTLSFFPSSGGQRRGVPRTKSSVFKYERLRPFSRSICHARRARKDHLNFPPLCPLLPVCVWEEERGKSEKKPALNVSPPALRNLRVEVPWTGHISDPLARLWEGGGPKKRFATLINFKESPPTPFALFVGGTTEREGGSFFNSTPSPLLTCLVVGASCGGWD